MRTFIKIIFAFLIPSTIVAQNKVPIDAIHFFNDESPVIVKITTDMKKLLNNKVNGTYMPAVFNWKLPDGTVINEPIRLHSKGAFRRTYCYIPPLKLNFHNTTSPTLYGLNSLKLSCGCKKGSYYDQLIFKEYLVNKIYNLLTDKSFRVRLAYLDLEDESGSKKGFTQYAFFTEDIADVAKRNKCKELTTVKVSTEGTNRDHMTLVALFEYMIGNTDWAVPVNHNIRLIAPRADSMANPYAIAFDFDCSGIVNPDYATPDPQMGIETVVERVYRGFPRSMDELQKSIQIFLNQKDRIYSLVKNFALLTSSNRQDMLAYLDQFYGQITDKKMIQDLFITNARKQ